MTKITKPIRKLYTTAEVSELTGATARQLQLWDQDGIVRPKHEGRRRSYSEDQIAIVRKIVQLRIAGVGVKRAAKILAEEQLAGETLVITGSQCVRISF